MAESTVGRCTRQEVEEFWGLLEQRGQLFGVPLAAALTAKEAVCCREDDHVVGIAGLRPHRTGVHLLFIAVDQDHRGCGIGGRLIAALLGAYGDFHRLILLTVARDNVSAIRLYLRTGFVTVCSTSATLYMARFSPHSNSLLRMGAAFLLSILLPLAARSHRITVSPNAALMTASSKKTVGR